jgi:hypothetical protein
MLQLLSFIGNMIKVITATKESIMIFNPLTKATLTLLAICIAQPVLAAQTAATDLAVELTVYQVTNRPDGKETLTPAEQAKPGDVLEYQAVYRNRGKKLAKSVRASLPIPTGNAVLAVDSPRPANPLASTDGSRFAPFPLMRWVVLPDGQREQRPVAAAEYRTLRWELGDLAPGSSAKVSARVRVENAIGDDTAIIAATQQRSK